MSEEEVEVVEQVVVAVVLRGFCRGEGSTEDDARRRIGILGRVHALAAEHGERHGGRACPSGTDAVLLRFDGSDGVPRAVSSSLELVAEVEGARDPDSHRHHGLLAVGVDIGPVAVGPDGRILGVPVGRAVRIAIAAESRGEVWISDAVRSRWAVAEGLGVQGLGRGAQARLDLPIGAFVVSDYRN